MAFLVKHGRLDELKGIVQRLEPGYVPSAADQFTLPHAQAAHGAPIGKRCSRTGAVSVR